MQMGVKQMNKPLQWRYKRYMEIDGYMIEFYLYGDDTTPVVKVSIVEQVKVFFFFKRYRRLFSDTELRYKIRSYEDIARKVIKMYESTV